MTKLFTFQWYQDSPSYRHHTRRLHDDALRLLNRRDHLAFLARRPEAMTQQAILELKGRMGMPTMLEERRGEVEL